MWPCWFSWRYLLMMNIIKFMTPWLTLRNPLTSVPNLLQRHRLFLPGRLYLSLLVPRTSSSLSPCCYVLLLWYSWTYCGPMFSPPKSILLLCPLPPCWPFPRNSPPSKKSDDQLGTSIAFPDPQSFVAGKIHSRVSVWEKIALAAPYDFAPVVLDWIKHSVHVEDFFQSFKGRFAGENYDSPVPLSKIVYNHLSCKGFAQFILDAILDRLAMGAISLWGKVGEVPPPYLVMPLTVEPSKPRLCNDNRFLNLWIKDTPFRLDTLPSLNHYVSLASYQMVCDEKSGYDHIFLSQASHTYFGFQWGSWFFTCNTLPFGWKSSAYVYQSTGLLATHYFRSISVPCSLYIDDHHTGELLIPPDAPAYVEYWGAIQRC